MGADDSHRSGVAPALLLSMPQLMDPNFHRAVVLLCEHTTDGAFGLVINRPTDTSASEAVQLSPPPERDGGLSLWTGGPVEPQRGWILMGDNPDHPYTPDNLGTPDNLATPGKADDIDTDASEAILVAPGLYLSTSPILLRRLLERAPPRTRVLTGYAGWGPGQLDAELSSSAWLIADVDRQLIFDTPPDAMWETAIRSLGADPGKLQMGQGVH